MASTEETKLETSPQSGQTSRTAHLRRRSLGPPNPAEPVDLPPATPDGRHRLRQQNILPPLWGQSPLVSALPISPRSQTPAGGRSRFKLQPALRQSQSPQQKKKEESSAPAGSSGRTQKDCPQQQRVGQRPEHLSGTGRQLGPPQPRTGPGDGLPPVCLCGLHQSFRRRRKSHQGPHLLQRQGILHLQLVVQSRREQRQGPPGLLCRRPGRTAIPGNEDCRHPGPPAAAAPTLCRQGQVLSPKALRPTPKVHQDDPRPGLFSRRQPDALPQDALCLCRRDVCQADLGQEVFRSQPPSGRLQRGDRTLLPGVRHPRHFPILSTQPGQF